MQDIITSLRAAKAGLVAKREMLQKQLDPIADDIRIIDIMIQHHDTVDSRQSSLLTVTEDVETQKVKWPNDLGRGKPTQLLNRWIAKSASFRVQAGDVRDMLKAKRESKELISDSKQLLQTANHILNSKPTLRILEKVIVGNEVYYERKRPDESPR